MKSQGMVTPVRYPDPAVKTLDPRFAPYKLGSAAVERLWTGARWAEGPVYFGDARCVIFSDIPNNRMLCWHEDSGETSVFRAPSNNANGHTRDKQGRLVGCEHDTRRVVRTEWDGSITILADAFGGKPLNAPNDVVVHSDGAIWFSDPGYGILWEYEGHKATPEIPNAVYRLDPASGVLTRVSDALDRPNGLCFSPDGARLYVVDSGTPKNIVVYDVDDNKLFNQRVFVDMKPGSSDGIRCDVDGNLWAAAGWGGEGYDGVHIFAPDGVMIGQILLPEPCANLTFGGRKKNRLFMAASQSLYSLYTDAKGAQWP